jgi:hypothetical protein
MKIKSGNTTTRLPFIAVDETDKITRLSGLSSFTVYRDRNGAGPIQMTTPTIVEASGVYMAGLYWLLVDEDTELEEGVYEHTMVFHISHAGMFPVFLAAEVQENLAVDMSGRLPDALDGGYLKAAIKKVGNTVLTPGGVGGQEYGG